MRAVSATPGRLRLHLTDLTGRRGLCGHLTIQLAQLDGVGDAYASHRTGQLLVLYDTDKTDKEKLVSEIREMVVTQKDNVSLGHYHWPRNSYRSNGNGSLRGVAGELANLGVRSVLPRPWNTLLPVAVSFIRRQSL